MAAVACWCRRVCVNTPGLDKRAMLVGQLNKFILWNEDDWNAQADADLAAIKQPGGLPDELRDLIL